MQAKGQLFIMSAPSGCGKTTLERMLIDSDLNLKKSISVTTRKPRKGEEEGRDYYFISEKEFFKRRDNGEFLEWAKVFGHYYASPKDKIERYLNEKKNILLSIDIQGAKQIKKIYPDAVYIFIKPPSLKDLEARLKARGTDNKEDIEERLKVAKEEIRQSKMYDYVVVNDKIDRAYQQLKEIIKNNIEG